MDIKGGYKRENKISLQNTNISDILIHGHAGVAELADALDLGSSVNRCAGSSPVTRTLAMRSSYMRKWRAKKGIYACS